MSELRAIIDTGVVVSAVLLPQSVPRQVFDLVVSRGCVLVSAATIGELEEVLSRPKFNRYARMEERLDFLASLAQEAQRVIVTEIVTECRDPKDNKFLELALSGQASCLIAGDQDLLALHPFRGIPILTPVSFLEWLSEGNAAESHQPT
jgi:uncharacterized protein